MDPARRERRVRIRHLERVHGLGAERDRADRVQRRPDAELVRLADDVLRADDVDELRVDRVHGMRRRIEEAHVAARLVRVVVHVPRLTVERALRVGDRELRRAGQTGRHRDALVDRRCERERLERAPCRSTRLRGEVELHRTAVGQIRDHRLHGPVSRIDCDERCGGIGLLAQHAADGGSRGVLHARVERGAHLKPARLDLLLAEARDELIGGPAEEVRVALRAVQRAGLQADRVVDRARVLRRADQAVLQHRAQHLVAPPERVRRMADRIVDRRRLRQPCEERRLRERQPLRARREERLRACLRAERMPAVEHLVEIRAEDPALRPCLRELLGEARLLQLARQRLPRLPDVEIPDELLRDRRAALDDAPRTRHPCRARARSPGSRARRAARSGCPRSRPSPSAATATSCGAEAADGSWPTGSRQGGSRRTRRGTSSTRARPGAASSGRRSRRRAHVR